jgi:NADP-dependent 3-hydroxy acid dehydrogenase YdfG
VARKQKQYKEEVLASLDGRNAIVTGASSGFGKSIALAFAQAGANVALVARRADPLQEVADAIMAQGCTAVVCAADVADEAQIAAAVEQARRALGPIHLLVNNAGMNVTQRSIKDTSSEQWRQLLDVNLTSAFVFTKLLLPEMIERQAGTIINVASRAALRPHLTGGVGYSTSKMGMDALTQVTNEEANPHNVRACLLCPGAGNTPIMDRRPSPPSMEQRARMLQPEDVAEVAVLVASMPPHVNIDLISLVPTRV